VRSIGDTLGLLGVIVVEVTSGGLADFATERRFAWRALPQEDKTGVGVLAAPDRGKHL
jgi:hypothetical protein